MVRRLVFIALLAWVLWGWASRCCWERSRLVASVVLGLPLALCAMLKVDRFHTPNAQASSAVTAVIHGNVPLYAAQLLVGLACSVLGGYVAAWPAKHDELLNGGLSSVLCVVLSIYTISTSKDSNPHWLQVLLLIASPLLALLGGSLMRLFRRSRLQSA